MILSYSKENCELYRFPKKIIAGSKIHTIRADYANRWKVGRSIQHATGLRTKYYHCFSEGICQGIQLIKFSFFSPHVYIISIDNKIIKDIEQLAINDGFYLENQFIDYFWDIAEQSNTSELEMKIIHFTNFKY